MRGPSRDRGMRSMSFQAIVGCFLVLMATNCALASNTVLMDGSGSLHRQIPDVPASDGVVAVIASPGTMSTFGVSSQDVLSLQQEADGAARLVCRGATLSHPLSASERNSLATTSIAADSVVVDGITEGDIAMGLRNSRHARTLTALIRARLASAPARPLTIMLGVAGHVDDKVQDILVSEVRDIFQATAVEFEDDLAFEDVCKVVAVPVETADDARQALAAAQAAAKSTSDGSTSLAQRLSDAQAKIRDSGVATEALDPPDVAQAYLTCRQAYAKQARAVRAKVAAWRSRVSRGLTVDGFGKEAKALMDRILVQGYDSETLSSVGVPLVAPYRLDLRVQLEALVDSAIRELFIAQVVNLEKSMLQKFEAQLLRQQGTASSEEAAFGDNAATMRNAAYNFDQVMSDLEIPSLGLNKERASQEMSSKLNDALVSFPDSPAAQLKRIKAVKKVTSKERKPSQRSIDIGLDLVAMIRPDGFGSFQGFTGYQLGGNSITVGVHNDADDPQVIAQFGGVRPPLLRIQPKLRVDLEL